MSIRRRRIIDGKADVPDRATKQYDDDNDGTLARQVKERLPDEDCGSDGIAELQTTR